MASVREQLVRERRVVLVSGPSRIGKTSFLRRLSAELPDAFLPILVELAAEPRENPERATARIAEVVRGQVSGGLSLAMPEPAWGDSPDNADRFLTELWPLARARMGERTLVLLLDDLDRLQDSQGGLPDSLAGFLLRWRRQDHRLAFVVSGSSSALPALEREHPTLFAGAGAVALGPLPNEDAIRLITQPVEGRLAFDHGVPRRLVELTSGHPFYLQLVCSAVYDRCAAEGWVNQHDVDLVLEGLAGWEIPEFRHVWDGASPHERSVLAALASLRGARGVATANEILGLLVRAGARVTQAQVLDVLDRLSTREVVERLGALSYRFRVALMRDWLERQMDLRQAMGAARWEAPGRRRARQLSKAVPHATRALPGAAGHESDAAGKTPEERSDVQGAGGSGSRPRSRAWIVLAGLACLALIVAGGWLARQPGRATPTPSPAASVMAPATGRPTVMSALPTTTPLAPTASPIPTAMPTPSLPVITSRSLPAIAYLSKPRAEGLWTIYVMGSDGSSRVPIAEASSDFVSAPSWSPNGDRLAFVSDRDGSADIWIVDREGRRATNLTGDAAKDSSPAWSPDGEWIAFASVRDSPYWELYAMRPDGSAVRRLTWWQDASDLWPSWSPDGSRIAFASKRDGNWEIYTMASDGSDLVRLTDNPADDMHPAWSPNGQWIGFDSLREGYSDVFVVPASGGEATNLTNLAWASDLGPTWSPDGSRIAFCSDRNGDWDIYVMAIDGTGLVKLTTSDTQDQIPAWRP